VSVFHLKGGLQNIFSGKYCSKTCQDESTDIYGLGFFGFFLFFTSFSCSILAQAILVEEGGIGC